MSALFKKIQAADFSYPRWFSQEVRGLLDRIMTVDVNKRLTIPQMKEDPWITLNGTLAWPEVDPHGSGGGGGGGGPPGPPGASGGAGEGGATAGSPLVQPSAQAQQAQAAMQHVADALQGGVSARHPGPPGHGEGAVSSSKVAETGIGNKDGSM
mmetsp:Transcript_7323/g.11626  ORF Transcript_7323/g.11626 Transcript_7323/m.11626 type:complete len:154 (+) Transcript_7323:164-625(+)